jgi:O-antigen ligase
VMTYEEGQGETSLGLRFDMWKAALAAFAENPLFGVGPMGFREVLAARVEAGFGSPLLAGFEHAHSDALHALATGGLVAFTGLVAAYWLPWRYFRRMHARHPSAAARAGMALVLTFVILGLSDTMFVHRIALSAYVIGIAALLGYTGLPSVVARSQKREPVTQARSARAQLEPVDPP